MFLELAYHDEENGGQTFKLQARIAELWQFKVPKSEETSRRRSSSHLQAWFMASKE